MSSLVHVVYSGSRSQVPRDVCRSIDDVPNNGGGRQAAYLPYSGSIAEFRIDTTGFDVSQGRGNGTQIVAMTKAGTNQYHGTMTEQHWQQRYNGTPYFSRKLYFQSSQPLTLKHSEPDFH